MEGNRTDNLEHFGQAFYKIVIEVYKQVSSYDHKQHLQYLKQMSPQTMNDVKDQYNTHHTLNDTSK